MIRPLTDDTVQTNLYTIGPHLTAEAIQLTICHLSDCTQQSAWFSMGAILASMIGWILLGSLDLVNHVRVGYFLTYLLTFRTFTPALLIPAWVGGNTPSNSVAPVLGSRLNVRESWWIYIICGVPRPGCPGT